MFETIAIILLIIFLIIVLSFIYLLTTVWWQSRKQPPAFPMIVQKYYVCRKHRILKGGIFGKGPLRTFADENGQSWCWRDEWEEIDRKTFKMLASKWYGVDWSDEIPFWQDD